MLLKIAIVLEAKGIFFKEVLTKEMVYLEYHARVAYEANQIGTFSTKKDHLLFLLDKGVPSVKVTSIPKLNTRIARVAQAIPPPKQVKSQDKVVVRVKAYRV